jgi:hypothetical protein
MPAPIVYHGNVLASGSFGVKGQLTNTEFDPIDPENPVARVIDGSVLLKHTPSGELYAGDVLRAITYQVVATADHSPDTLIFYGTASSDANSYVLGQSTDFIGTGSYTNWSGNIGPVSGLLIQSFTNPAQTSKLYWRFGSVGLAAWEVMVPREMWIATSWTMPRSPSVGIDRTRVRQFTRLDIPNGQPFVKRRGALLRQTTYNSVMVSGTEINAFNAMLSDIEGGEIFPFTDDLGDSYLAELVGPAIVEQDEAGIYTVGMTFREVEPEIFS